MSETALRLRDELGRLPVAERAELAKFLSRSRNAMLEGRLSGAPWQAGFYFSGTAWSSM